jgi:hypothetical protein
VAVQEYTVRSFERLETGHPPHDLGTREAPLSLGNVSINNLPLLTFTPPMRPATQGADHDRHPLRPNATRPMLAGKVLLSDWLGFCQREGRQRSRAGQELTVASDWEDLMNG